MDVGPTSLTPSESGAKEAAAATAGGALEDVSVHPTEAAEADADTRAALPSVMEVVPDSELVDVESLEVWLKDEALVAEGAVGSAMVGPTGDAVYVSRNVRGGRDIGVVDGMRPCEDATAVAGTISVSEFRVNFDGCDPAWVRLQNYGMELVVASSAGLVRARKRLLC